MSFHTKIKNITCSISHRSECAKIIYYPSMKYSLPQGPVCVCVFVCVRLCATFSDGLYLSSPLPALNLRPSRRLFKQPLIIWVRFKVWTPSLCQQKFYTCSSFTESGEYPGADPPRQPQRWHTRTSDTVWGETVAGALHPRLAPGPFVCVGDLSPCRYTRCSTLRTLGENKRFWMDILGASPIH